MKVYIIAQIMNESKVVGYRILDVDDKNKTQNCPVDSIIKVLSNPATSRLIVNAQVIDGKLVGTNGQLSRYPKVTLGGKLITHNGYSPMIVLNKIDNIGYTVCDYQGRVKKLKNSDVVEYAKKGGIANGKLVMQDDVEYISSISDSYEQIHIAPSKLGKTGKVNMGITISTDAKTVAKNVEKGINTELQYTDVFSAMTSEQRSVLKQFYTWHTVDVYKSMAKNTRLNLAPGKAEKLAQLRGIDKWEFAGINDSYLEGRTDAKCELGHSLRYEYFAVPVEDDEGTSNKRVMYLSHKRVSKELREKQDELKMNGAIVFGETCAGDFFRISPDDMKKLVKTRKIMSEEIELMADIITNKQESEYVNKCRLLYDCISEINSTQNIVNVFGNDVGNTLIAFIKEKLPFPKSLVILAGDRIRKNKSVFFQAIFKNEISSDNLNKILSTDTRDYNAIPGLSGANKVLDYVANYTIEGDYQYDPLNDKEKTRRDIGAYNKETRMKRYALISEIRNETTLSVSQMSKLEYLKQYMKIVNEMINASDEIEGYISKTEYISKMYQVKYRSLSRALVFEILDRNESLDEEAITKFTTMINMLAFTKYSGHQSSLGDKVRTHEKYRTMYRYNGFNELKSTYESTMRNNSIQSLIKDTLMLSENILKSRDLKEKEALARLENEKKEKIEKRKQEELKEQQELKEQMQDNKIEYEKKEKIEKKEQQEKLKEEHQEDKTMAELRKLIDEHPNVNDYGVEVAKDILKRGTPYKDLSAKQRWRVDDTIKRLKSTKENETLEVSSGKMRVTDDAYKKISDKIDKIKQVAADEDGEMYKKVIEASPIVYKIIITIEKKGECSSKQLKHIDKAYDVIMKNQENT